MPRKTYERVIYFPTSYERRREPYVIFVERSFPETHRGNPDAEQLEDGRFAHFLKNRCRPYSDELWEKCKAWIARSRALQDELQGLTGGKRPRVRAAEVVV